MPVRTPADPHTLPPPSADAQALSARLLQSLHDRIVTNGGWLGFADYMQHILYAPGLGYYSNGTIKLGQDGDFVTAPEISALFGQTLARQIREVLSQLPADAQQIMEFGPGSGKLAFDILTALAAEGHLPTAYYFVEVSADLRERQQARFAAEAPELLSRLHWLDQLPTQFSGMMIGNEVLDAIPTHLLQWDNAPNGVQLDELGVAWEAGLVWASRPASDALIAATATLPTATLSPEALPYRSEVQCLAAEFVRTLGQVLDHGALLLIDYGFTESEYYHPQRNSGTLMCHYRHFAHTDPLILPGLQDVTTHIDFTAMAIAGVESGMMLAGYTSQATFLANAGITALLSQIDSNDIPRYLPLANQTQRLMSPAEMGEFFKVIAFSKGEIAPLSGFAQGDRSHRL